jgi:rhomboid protease GluP
MAGRWHTGCRSMEPIEDPQLLGIARSGTREHADGIFCVRFGLRGRIETSQTDDVLRLAGSGTLEVRGDKVFLTAVRHRTLRRSQMEKHALDWSDIFNVQFADTTMRFECRLADGRQGHVVLEAVDPGDAARIADLLPNVRTEAFAIDQIDRADFHRRLDRLSSRARVTPALVAINLFVFALMLFDGAGLFVADPRVAMKWGSNFAPLTMDGAWWRLFTAMFIHFGILHVALNMWALYLSGKMTERLYGSARFAVVYVFAGLTGGMASLLWNPEVNSAGASGAIFGVFGAMLAFVVNPRNGVPRSIMIEHRNSTLAFAAYSLFYGAAHAGIDNAAHVGGLLGGFLMGVLLARPLDDAHRVSSHGGRLIAAAGTGLLAWMLLLYPLVHPRDAVRNGQAFDRALLTFSTQDDRASNALLLAVSLADRNNGGTANGFAHIIESDVFPQWNALYDEMAAPRLAATDPRSHEQMVVLRYLDARRRYCQLIVKAALQHDRGLERQAQVANQDAEVVFAQLKQLDVQRGRQGD